MLGLRPEVDELAAKCPAEPFVLVLRVDQDHIILIFHEHLHHFQFGGKPFAASCLSKDKTMWICQYLPVAADDVPACLIDPVE